jgi:hypothetical protein
MTSESHKASRFRKILSDTITELKSLSSPPESGEIVVLDRTPTGQEEEELLFDNPVEEPADLNDRLDQVERVQDMTERKKFADRAFAITVLWVAFLIILPFVQMFFSIWGMGLTDAQFITVVTTTTAAVFGFWMLVGRYLFPSRNSK